MITTSCPACDTPALIGTGGAIFGTYAPHDCRKCGTTLVVEVTRTGGKTHTQEVFEDEVLPELDGIERIDHPSGEATIYADPEKVGIIE